MRKYALSIAGFDPSAGAGVLADVKTFESHEVYGMGVVSALTWQNDITFGKVEWIPVQNIKEQIALLLQRFDIRHIKIGLIESMEVLNELVKFLHSNIQDPIIVWDPILRASAGFSFHKVIGSQPGELTRGIYCITPNIPEAEQLIGTEQMQEKLEALSETVNIYLKGGHADGDTSLDMLFTSDHTYVFSNERLENGAKHGSGCVLSSALTAQLALGNDLPAAAEHANAYTHRFLSSNETLLGYHQPFTA